MRPIDPKRGSDMLKRVCSVLMFFFLVLTSVTAFAENVPSGRWWRNARVVQELSLTSGEKQRLENAYQNSRRKLIQKKGRVETEQIELENLMGRRKINEKAIRAQNRKLEKARSDLADEKFAFVIEVRKIIGHERFQKLVNIYRKQSKNR